MMTAPTDGRKDQAINWIAMVTLLLVAGSLIVASVALPAIFSTSDSVSATKRAGQLRECTTKESAKVTDAQTAVITAGQARDSLTQEFLQALQQGDQATQDRLTAEAPQSRQIVTDLTAALKAANEVYQAKLVQSREHPDQFLKECSE